MAVKHLKQAQSRNGSMDIPTSQQKYQEYNALLQQLYEVNSLIRSQKTVQLDRKIESEDFVLGMYW